VSPVPSSVRELLGMAGFRGSILPVYDLRLLLGVAPAGQPRWWVVAAGEPVALAFDSLDGHLRLARDRIAGDSEARSSAVSEIASGADPRPIVRLPSILDTITHLARGARVAKEQ
jgi:purine-binding chemotaxis protein CheW